MTPGDTRPSYDLRIEGSKVGVPLRRSTLCRGSKMYVPLISSLSNSPTGLHTKIHHPSPDIGYGKVIWFGDGCPGIFLSKVNHHRLILLTRSFSLSELRVQIDVH